MRRRRALELVGSAALLPACTRAGTSGANVGRRPWTQPHVLRWADAEDPVGLNPVVTTHATTVWIANLWAAYLFRFNAQFEPVPELATEVPTVANGLISKDGKRITYHLREAVWSDGTPFTSRDVAFSVKVVLDPHTNVTSREGWDQIERVETPDDRTAIFQLKNVYSAFIPTFFTTGGANPCLLPEHIVKNQDANRGDYNVHPIGIGPFIIEEWQRGQHVTLRPNPRYWRGKPKLTRIVYKVIPDANTLITQMRTHEVDLWMQMNSKYLDTVGAIEGVSVLRRRSLYWRHLDCNCSHQVLAEIPVRQALNYAIDRATIIEKVLHNVGELNWSVLSPQSPVYNPDVRRYPFDLAKAGALLDGAGWRRGADGVRVKDGRRLSLLVTFGTGNPAWEQTIELIRSTWSQIGVAIETKTYPSSLYFAQFQNGGIVQGGKFDICAFTWGNTPSPTTLVNLYSSDTIPPAGQNDVRYKNAEVTRLLHGATRTYDPAEQKRLVQRAQAIIADEAPIFPLSQDVDLYPINSDLRGFDPNSTSPFDWMMDADI